MIQQARPTVADKKGCRIDTIKVRRKMEYYRVQQQRVVGKDKRAIEGLIMGQGIGQHGYRGQDRIHFTFYILHFTLETKKAEADAVAAERVC